MSQAATRRSSPIPFPAPPRALSPQEQLDALRRVQAQAEQRVYLGAQFFKAAEARTDQFREMIEKIKSEQDTLREELRDDMTKSLRTYDQWLGEIDQDLTTAIGTLEERVTKLQQEWAQAQQRIDSLLRRSEAMFDQTRMLNDRLAGTPQAAPALPAPMIDEQPIEAVESRLVTQETASEPNAAAFNNENLVITPLDAETSADNAPGEEPATGNFQLYSQLLDQLRKRADNDQA
ncbi:MAG: hypothetical protein K8S99_07700 [Planctomycetes bacterium]|nr:hypothetical protein [Planctomycetota bacterium]